MFVPLCAERKLDSFVASQFNRNVERTASRHRDNVSTVNCSDIDTSPANDIEYRQSPCEFSNSGSITLSRSLLNISESKADCDSESADVSFQGEIMFTDDRQAKCSADLSRTVDVHKVDDFVVNTSAGVCKRDTVEIDSNCNSIFTDDCNVDLNVSLGGCVVDCSRDNGTSPSASYHDLADDRMSRSDQASQESNVGTDSVHDRPAVVTVWRIAV